ncbi:MAG: chorismate synthase [Myxococcota bacterium]|jgi:chorismate synthase
MSNKFGKLFSFTSWGESHGEAIGCVIDGCPSMIELCEDDIQKYLDRRRPGQSKFTTQRKEADEVKILSGVFEGKTTGTPISLIIYNSDQKSGDYSDIKDKFRPSHADYTYFEKYGIRDYRGGGRSSARETAMRVAAGAVAIKVLEKENIQITGYLKQLGDQKIDPTNIDFEQINKNDFFCPDQKSVKIWEDYLTQIRKSGNSCGAIIELVAKGVPVGLGEPIYNKLDTAISAALMSINATKAVEIGNGIDAASLNGEENADEMWMENGELQFSSNNAGGILGGISSGQDLVARFTVKPTSSILKPRKTIDVDGNNTEIITKGRHDPCVGIRAVPVGEAMMACVILDFLLINRSYKNLHKQ